MSFRFGWKILADCHTILTHCRDSACGRPYGVRRNTASISVGVCYKVRLSHLFCGCWLIPPHQSLTRQLPPEGKPFLRCANIAGYTKCGLQGNKIYDSLISYPFAATSPTKRIWKGIHWGNFLRCTNIAGNAECDLQGNKIYDSRIAERRAGTARRTR